MPKGYPNSGKRKKPAPRVATVKVAKAARAEITMVAQLIDELVEKRLAPVREELIELRVYKKKYLALKAALTEDDA